jgi:hypothetical protein
MFQDKVDAAIAQFPKVFGLRGFPGSLFVISGRNSYANWNRDGSFKDVQLVVADDQGRDFCRTTPAELSREVVREIKVA